MATLKVKSAGKFGSRYGVRVRRNFLAVEAKQNQESNCPRCGSNRVTRQNRGVFYCGKCENEFVGGAFMPETLTGSIVKRMILQKTFMPAEMGLINSEDKAAPAAAKKPKRKEKKEAKAAAESSDVEAESEALVEEDH